VSRLETTTDLPTAGSVLGIGRTRAFELARSVQFPGRLIRLGRRVLVLVPELLDLSAPLRRSAPATPHNRRSAVIHMESMDDDQLWNVEDVATYCKVPMATVRRWRAFGEGPPGFRIGKHVRFRKSLVMAWVREQEQKSLR
jgi:excisionase family DNA binding protein